MAWSRTDHYVETLASRVEVGDSSMVFSADTGPEWDITQLGPDIGLLIAELHFSHIGKRKNLHLQLAKPEDGGNANVSHLVLSHLAQVKTISTPSGGQRSFCRGNLSMCRQRIPTK